jgi:hypothetical protein
MPTKGTSCHSAGNLGRRSAPSKFSEPSINKHFRAEHVAGLIASPYAGRQAARRCRHASLSRTCNANSSRHKIAKTILGSPQSPLASNLRCGSATSHKIGQERGGLERAADCKSTPRCFAAFANVAWSSCSRAWSTPILKTLSVLFAHSK